MTTFSITTCQRIAAAHAVLARINEELADCETQWSDAQNEWKELFTELRETQEEVEGDKWSDDERRDEVAAVSHNLVKAKDAFDVLDREKKSLQRRGRKLTGRLMEIISEAIEGDDLFSHQETKTAEADRWRLIPIADLIGVEDAKQFHEQGIHNVGHYYDGVRAGTVAALVEAGEIKQTLQYELRRFVDDFLENRGVEPISDKEPRGAAEARERKKTERKKKRGSKKTSKKKTIKKKVSASTDDDANGSAEEGDETYQFPGVKAG